TAGNSGVTVTFTDEVLEAPDATNFVVHSSMTGLIPGVMSGGSGINTVTLTPTNNFFPNDLVFVTASTFTNTLGYTAPYSISSFRVTSAPAPVLFDHFKLLYPEAAQINEIGVA